MKLSDGEASHASVAVAVAKLGVDGQLIVLGAGSAAIVGAVTSCTLITCDAVAELPQTSVAVQVRVTVKLLAHVPAVVTLLNVSAGLPVHASVAVAVAKLGEIGRAHV